MSCVFFPARQGAEGNSRHSDRNIRGTCAIVCHRQKLVAQFKRGDFSTCDAPRSGRPKTVTPLESHQGGLVLARQYPGSPGTCNPEETGLPGLPLS